MSRWPDGSSAIVDIPLLASSQRIGPDDTCITYLSARCRRLLREEGDACTPEQKPSCDVGTPALSEKQIQRVAVALQNDVAACHERRWSQFSFPPLSPVAPPHPRGGFVPPVKKLQPPLSDRLVTGLRRPGVQLIVETEGPLEPSLRSGGVPVLRVRDVETSPNGGKKKKKPGEVNWIRLTVLREEQEHLDHDAAVEGLRVTRTPFLFRLLFRGVHLSDLLRKRSETSLSSSSSCWAEEVESAPQHWVSHVICPSVKELHPQLSFLFHPQPAKETRSVAGSVDEAAFMTEVLGGPIWELPSRSTRHEAVPCFTPQYLRGTVGLQPDSSVRLQNESLLPPPTALSDAQHECGRRLKLHLSYGRLLPPPSPSTERQARSLGWCRHLLGSTRVWQVDLSAMPSKPGKSLGVFPLVTRHLTLKRQSDDPRWETAVQLSHAAARDVVPRAKRAKKRKQHAAVRESSSDRNALPAPEPCATDALPLLTSAVEPSAEVFSLFLSRGYHSATQQFPGDGVWKRTSSAFQYQFGAGVSQVRPTAPNSSSEAVEATTPALLLVEPNNITTQTILPATPIELQAARMGYAGIGVFGKLTTEGWWSFRLPRNVLFTLRQHSGLLLSYPCTSHAEPSNYEKTDRVSSAHEWLTVAHALSWPAREVRGWAYTGNKDGKWQSSAAKWFSVLSAELTRESTSSKSWKGKSEESVMPASTTKRRGLKDLQWTLFWNAGCMGPSSCMSGLWPKASAGISVVSYPQYVIDLFNMVTPLRQELSFSWVVDRKPGEWFPTLSSRSGPEQKGVTWQRGPFEFFDHVRFGITWKW